MLLYALAKYSKVILSKWPASIHETGVFHENYKNIFIILNFYLSIVCLEQLACISYT